MSASTSSERPGASVGAQSARPDLNAPPGQTADPPTPEQSDEPARTEPEPDQASAIERARREVPILDLPSTRIRRPADLVNLIATALGIAVVLILSVYAYSTATAVTHDVQNALAQVIRGLLLVPVTVIEGLLILALPIVVIVVQAMRRNFRGILEALIASAAAFGLAVLAVWLIDTYAAGTDIARAVTRSRSGQLTTTISPAVAALSGLLTAVGSRAQRRVVAISWNLLWVALGVSVITGDATLVAVIVTVLLGRMAGLAMRYAAGVRGNRAYGQTLADGVRTAGIEPLAIVRVGDATDEATLQTHTATVPALGNGTDTSVLPPGERHALVARAVEATAHTPALALSATVAAERPGQNRVYAVIGADGTRWDAVVLDGDRQMLGTLSAFWSTLRLRGLERRTTMSLRQAAERAALMYYAATAAGVNSPRLRGIAEESDSVILLGEHIPHARSVRDADNGLVTHEVMVRAWQQLQVAHDAGLAHRNLSAETVLVAASGEHAGQVWLNGWEQGEIAANALAQRVDQAQLLAMFALRVGAEAAVGAAHQVLSRSQLAEIAPLLQPVAFPADTRSAARAGKATMAELRTALLGFIPDGVAAEPIRLTRFSARTVVMMTVAVVAIWIVLTTMNFAQVRTVLLQADPIWMALAFAIGLISYLGAAIGLMAFCPERLNPWRTTLVQVAASILSLIAPAGVGPAALNVRFMQRQGIKTPLALATVALLQLSQFVTTILLVVVLALFLGTAGPLQQLPSVAVVITLAAVAAVAGGVLLIPPVRTWLMSRILPTWRQVWPRVVWVLGQPRRLLVGVTGALMLTGGFLGAFAAVLHSLDTSLPVTTLAIVYLTGNTVGSAVPTPGGMGAVELALSAGLRATGVATAAAASAAVLFRVLTFWIRIPLGWLAWRYLQRREEL